VISLLPSPAPVGALRSAEGTSLQELQRQREQVRRNKAAKAGEVNVLEATTTELTAALGALQANVSAQQDRVEEAERAVTQAKADEAAAVAAQAEKQAELDGIVAQMKTSAVEAYVRMGSSSDALSTLGSDDVNDAVKKRTLLAVRANENVDLVERFRSVQEDLEIERAAADAAARRAEEKQAEVKDRMAELKQAEEQHAALAAAAEERLNSALAESAALANLDAGLSRSISAREAAIARQLAERRAAEAARQARLAARNRPSALPAAGGGSGSGGGGGGGGGGAIPPIAGSGSIVSVGGIRVHQSIAGNLQSMLAAASAAGIQLSGGGYRDPAGQIAVRRSNCGSSHYAIYEMPASSCRPPTARPGSSMHERGLAIDFTQGGRTLTRSTSAFQWLQGNAARFGFYNLPSEPWHWSTNGN
jgi:hypothetical protein